MRPRAGGKIRNGIGEKRGNNDHCKSQNETRKKRIGNNKSPHHVSTSQNIMMTEIACKLVQ
jgi:hypothetical protein